jgi:hypothetical protein
MPQHFCEFDAYGMATAAGMEPCGEPAVAKWRGKWLCEDHLESMEAAYELADVLNNVTPEEAEESSAQFDANLEEI